MEEKWVVYTEDHDFYCITMMGIYDDFNVAVAQIRRSEYESIETDDDWDQYIDEMDEENPTREEVITFRKQEFEKTINEWIVAQTVPRPKNNPKLAVWENEDKFNKWKRNKEGFDIGINYYHFARVPWYC